MDATTSWIEDKIAEHRADRGVGFVGLQRLVTAAVALRKKAGAVFGAEPPPGGFADSDRLYLVCCDALRGWTTCNDDETVDSLVRSILLHDLDVPVSDEQRQKYDERYGGEVDLHGATHRRDAVGDISRALVKLEAAGIDTSSCRVEELAGMEAAQDAWASSGASPGLIEFVAALPRKIEIEWTHGMSGLDGLLLYDLAEAAEMREACLTQLREAPLEAAAYYRPWSEAVVFLEVADGAGYVAHGRAGQVIYLDAEGNADLNGTVLSGSLKAFWSAWQALYFLDLRANVVELAKSGGLSGGALTRVVAQAIR